MAALGNPEQKLPPVIHVAGTNGKGSVIAFLKAMFEAAGLNVHVYTSPHLVHFHERIVLGGATIDDVALETILEECEAANAGAQITFFEITTAAAFLAFSRHPADVLLLETGLGGRFDSTNVIERPRLCAITPIAIDHTHFLGDTLEAIAFEKAGILKPGVECVVGPQPLAAAAVIADRAAAVGAELFRHGTDWRRDGGTYRDAKGVLDIPPPGLVGRHQLDNAAIALACVRRIEEFPIGAGAIADGIRGAIWPARLQRLTSGPLAQKLPDGWELWLDGGHNAAAAEALAAFAAQADDRPLHVVFGMLNNRDATGFLRPLAPYIQSLRCVTIPEEDNAHDAETLVAAARALGLDASPASGVEQAMDSLLEEENPSGRILICGSLYLAGAVLAIGG